MDKITPEQRSRIMSHIKGKDTNFTEFVSLFLYLSKLISINYIYTFCHKFIQLFDSSNRV